MNLPEFFLLLKQNVSINEASAAKARALGGKACHKSAA
jgi:hypothetical protein